MLRIVEAHKAAALNFRVTKVAGSVDFFTSNGVHVDRSKEVKVWGSWRTNKSTSQFGNPIGHRSVVTAKGVEMTQCIGQEIVILLAATCVLLR